VSRFLTTDKSSIGAFGDLRTAALTQEVAIDFSLPPSEAFVNIAANNLGSVSQDTTNKLLQVQSGASANSAAYLGTRRPVQHFPGQGGLVRFSGIFTAGVVGNVQLIGLGDESDGLFFSYNGVDFGVLRRTGGSFEVQQLVVSNGADNNAGTLTITLNGNAKEVEVENADTAREVAEAIAATDFSDVGDGWLTSIFDETVEFISYNSEVKGGAFSFADTDSTASAASFSQAVAGVAPTEEFIAQASWSDDAMDGAGATAMTLDPTKGNVFEIQYQWLGFGMIKFFIEEQNTGDFALVHKISYANQNTAPSLSNPTLPLCVSSVNTSNTSNVTVKSGSMAGFTEGIDRGAANAFFAAQGAKNVTSASEAPILTLSSKLIFQGSVNPVVSIPQNVNFSASGLSNKQICEFRIYRGASLTGPVAYTDVNTNFSVTRFDTAATGFSGGLFLLATEVANNVSVNVDLATLFGASWFRGESITITTTIVGGGAIDMEAAVSFTWVESF
jgi:hypothetical protein